METVNRSALFESPEGWGPGYALAIGRGPGVVVGPGTGNANVFAQGFEAKADEQFRVTARASSVVTPKSVAAIQVNWIGSQSQDLATSAQKFPITQKEKTIKHEAIAPKGTTQGILYVIPGGETDAVRYTEMTLSRLDPFSDFLHYKYFGIKGQSILASCFIAMLFLVSYIYFRKTLFRTGATLLSGIGTGVVRSFPLLALVLSGAMFISLEGIYEHNYDAQWHQGSVESVMEWNDLSLDLGGNPLHNFGIQHVIKPQLSPTFWIGHLVRANHRIQTQAAFQAMVLCLILIGICRTAGARLVDAGAISLIAVCYLCIPYLSDDGITLDITLGLLWQEGAIATLLAFYCFARIGYGSVRGLAVAWPIAGLAATTFWLYLAYPELIVFFTLATAGLCLGSLAGLESRAELSYKMLAAVLIATTLLAVGTHTLILNLFEYTPQMYFKKALINYQLLPHYWSNTSILLPSSSLWSPKVGFFFMLATAGIFLALRFGNSFARRIVWGGIGFEIAVHLFSFVNAYFNLAPMSFIYVELMGLSTVALLAALTVWTALQVGCKWIPTAYNFAASEGFRTYQMLSESSRKQIEQSFPFLALVLLAIALFYWSSTHIGYHHGWPPKFDSAPARIMRNELALRSGDEFKGKAVVLIGMESKGPATWGDDTFPVLWFKFRETFGNDLMNDVEVAGIPVANEYGHWISPPMLALLAAAFYRPDDAIHRAAQAPRVFRPNLARLLGVSLVVSDQALPGEIELYRGQAGDHPVYLHRVAGSNLGQYSPTKTVVAANAAQILDYLQAKGFDGKELAVVEGPVEQNLVPSEPVSITFHKGSRIHIETQSRGTSLLVLPFDYSHCLEVEGQGLDRMIPVNLSQTGLVVRGKVSLDIAYRYGLVKGTSCRKQDLERIRKLDLEEAATGRLFFDAWKRKADRAQQVPGPKLPP
jgi:hypothetical protein